MVLRWLKQHWDECLFGGVFIAMCCQIFIWLWPTTPIYSPMTTTITSAENALFNKPRNTYKLASAVAVKKPTPANEDLTPISLFQLAEHPKTIQKLQSTAKLKPVNINQATAEELEALPGIGPSLAQRILTLRQKQRITNLQDLDQVKGIGPTLLAKLEPYLSF